MAGVGAKAGDVIVEATGNVVALVVVEGEEQARAAEVGVCAEEHITIAILYNANSPVVSKCVHR